MRALTVGSAMIDIITLVAAENIERMRLHNDEKSFLLLEQGRKVAAQSITTHVGGGACNVGVSLARQGWMVEALARIGDDLNGRAVVEHLNDNTVSAVNLRMTPDVATGVAVMVAAHDRNATIFVHRGANGYLQQDDFPDAMFAEKDLVYVSALSNASADQFPAVVARAKTSGAFVATNPGIRQLSGKTDAFFDALPNIDLLSLNRVEAETLVPGLLARCEAKDKDKDDNSASTDADADAPPLLKRGLQFSAGVSIGLVAFAKALHACGVTWVLLTDGLDGAYLFQAGLEAQGWWCPAIKDVDVKGSAGAGDAFCSTLAGALVSQYAPEYALASASINAASVVGAVNTTDGLLDKDSLSSRVDVAGLNVVTL